MSNLIIGVTSAVLAIVLGVCFQFSVFECLVIYFLSVIAGSRMRGTV